ncbi:hypothetical protein B296_00027320 [Ensete ventricosum]|uniref:Uncharacterized protein n=1 Tax=Ensete ventricosum TaxID=4639 RepID=A0A426Z4T1_ENSVE|nr:hypothetical protein B296_00027320 [Ensete ventricosum]
MVRPYGVKGRKLKKRKVEETAPVEEVEEESPSDDGEAVGVEEETGNGAEIADNKKRVDETVNQMPGIPITASVDKTTLPGVIFVLEKACLEVGKVGKWAMHLFSLLPVGCGNYKLVFLCIQNFQILNSDDHANYLKKQHRNPADYRPDIIHQVCRFICQLPMYCIFPSVSNCLLNSHYMVVNVLIVIFVS